MIFHNYDIIIYNIIKFFNNLLSKAFSVVNALNGSFAAAAAIHVTYKINNYNNMTCNYVITIYITITSYSLCNSLVVLSVEENGSCDVSNRLSLGGSYVSKEN